VDVIYLEATPMCALFMCVMHHYKRMGCVCCQQNATIYSIGNDNLRHRIWWFCRHVRGSGNLYDIGSRATSNGIKRICSVEHPGAYLSMNGTEVNVTGGATELNTLTARWLGTIKAWPPER